MTNNKKSKNSNSHAGHRKRLRKRFIEEGSLDNFEYHQVLELLLFYAIKLQDTNELAHRILDEYGSFYELLNSPPKDIMKRCNLSENTAMLISSIVHIFKKYEESKLTVTKILDSPKIVCDYFDLNILKRENEDIYIVCLDANKRLIRMVNIGEKFLDFTDYTKKIIDIVLQYKCVYAIIGHSILTKKGRLSAKNVNIANFLKESLNKVSVTLTDYIIIYEDGVYYSFAEKSFVGYHIHFNRMSKSLHFTFRR